MIVTPVLLQSKLRISNKPRSMSLVEQTSLRWMQRAAQRRGRFINEPSLRLQTEYDIPRRQNFLYITVDSVENWAPKFLRRYKMDSKPVTIVDLE